jgi:16S rRNA (uracil1498-N3)-methyltransferase
MRHIPRFYCPDLILSAGARVILPETAAHHARVVLRVKDGAEVRLFNSVGGEWRGTCHYPDKRTVQVELQEKIADTETLRDVWLVLAPLKSKDSMDNAIRHAVELGVAKIVFVQTAYTQQTKLNAERLQQQIIDAAQQCGRITVPELILPQPLNKLLQDWPADRLLLACVEGEADSVKPLPQRSEGLGQQPLALLIGPEGGFSPEEKTLLTAGKKSWLQPAGLGPLVLRSDTAVAAGLGVLFIN